MLSRLVILISGDGSNLQAILEVCARGELSASVVCVISNKQDAYGLTRARNAGVEAIYFPKLENESRHDYDARLADLVRAKGPDTSSSRVGYEFCLPIFFPFFQIESSIYILLCQIHFPAYMPSNALSKPFSVARSNMPA